MFFYAVHPGPLQRRADFTPSSTVKTCVAWSRVGHSWLNKNLVRIESRAFVIFRDFYFRDFFAFSSIFVGSERNGLELRSTVETFIRRAIHTTRPQNDARDICTLHCSSRSAEASKRIAERGILLKPSDTGPRMTTAKGKSRHVSDSKHS